MVIAKMETFTVVVHVYAWMHSESDASKQLLLSYLEDFASGMDFRNHATACALAESPTLWFTFCTEPDANDFKTAIENLYRIGGWGGSNATA